jgi:hypothetical protein
MSDSLELIREAILLVQDAEALLERAERKVLDSELNAPRCKRSWAARPGPLPVAFERSWKLVERGAAELSINGSESVRLPPALAELAKVLVSGEGASQDEPVSWKGYARGGFAGDDVWRCFGGRRTLCLAHAGVVMEEAK